MFCGKCKQPKINKGCYCIPCRAESDARSYKKRRSKILLQKKEHRTKNIERYKEKDRVYHIKNREKLRLISRDRYRNNKEEIRKKAKLRYLRDKVKITLKAREYYAKNRLSVLETYRLRKTNNREKHLLQARIWSAKRRQKIARKSDKSITVHAIEELLAFQENLCALCKKNISSKDTRHLDHVIPLCIGGEHTLSNVQWLCIKCNLTKSRKNYERTSA